jgi:hypothetical protein
MLQRHYSFAPDSPIRKDLIESFGEDYVNEMTAGEMVFARQIQLAIKKTSPQAAQLVITQALGNASQDIDIRTGGQRIQQPLNDEQTDKIISKLIELNANKNPGGESL